MTLPKYLRYSAEAAFLLLLVLALVFPVIWGPMKAALLIYCVVAILLFEAMRYEAIVCLHPRTFIFFGAVICLNGFFVIWGMWNGAPIEGSEEAVRVYLFFPLVYLFLVAVTPSIISPKSLAKVLLLVSFLVSFLTIAQSIRVLGLGIVPGYSLLYHVYPGLYQDYMNFAFTGGDGYLPRATERLAFIGPFSVALIAVGRKTGLSNRLLWLNFVFVLIATVLTGRRVFLLSIVLTIFVLAFRRFLVMPRQVIRTTAVVASIGLLALATLQFFGHEAGDTESRAERISSDITDDFRDLTFSVRRSQIAHIVAEANKNPVLGVGFGNKIAGHVRDAKHPWRFELTYFALLFHTGFLGLLLYAIIGMQLLVLARHAWDTVGDVILPFIIGLAGGLLAASTNPYLSYGSGQWIIFLPVALFNAVLVQSARNWSPRVSPQRSGGEYGNSGIP